MLAIRLPEKIEKRLDRPGQADGPQQAHSARKDNAAPWHGRSSSSGPLKRNWKSSVKPSPAEF
jgi:hypothetical protein